MSSGILGILLLVWALLSAVNIMLDIRLLYLKQELYYNRKRRFMLMALKKIIYESSYKCSGFHNFNYKDTK